MSSHPMQNLRKDHLGRLRPTRRPSQSQRPLTPMVRRTRPGRPCRRSELVATHHRTLNRTLERPVTVAVVGGLFPTYVPKHLGLQHVFRVRRHLRQRPQIPNQARIIPRNRSAARHPDTLGFSSPRCLARSLHRSRQWVRCSRTPTQRCAAQTSHRDVNWSAGIDLVDHVIRASVELERVAGFSPQIVRTRLEIVRRSPALS